MIIFLIIWTYRENQFRTEKKEEYFFLTKFFFLYNNLTSIADRRFPLRPPGFAGLKIAYRDGRFQNVRMLEC